MQYRDIPCSLDLRGATCPMAFVKAKIHLDKLVSGERTTILFEQIPSNEPLVRSIRSLGHKVLSETSIADAPQTKIDTCSQVLPPDTDVQLTILEVEVKI
ncbi:MAG: sulfurtransferase TusA family protein [Alphaproteobacteria bacterium]|nr:sulfurtransferase TusA family protein [Alphaproteobacteria bacterium]